MSLSIDYKLSNGLRKYLFTGINLISHVLAKMDCYGVGNFLRLMEFGTQTGFPVSIV
ncbi:MAG: hypothetical protein ACTS6P_01680 [Candidatus Hodgkinia cicadicola]